MRDVLVRRCFTSAMVLALSSVPGDRVLHGQANAARPELPRVMLTTAMPSVRGRTISVGATGSLQAALDRARPGDEIVLQAGATYAGTFRLPVKRGAARVPGTDDVITVRSSAIARLAEGRRVRPADTVSMARVMTTRNGAEAIGTMAGTAGWRFVGLEITAAPSVTSLGRLVRFGDGNASAQKTAASVPHNLVIDRSYIHAGPRLDVRRCIDLHSGASAVVDSYIAGCHSANGDAQAIVAYNGPGPYKIVNNHLEGTGENVMIGGATSAVPGQIPSDIEIRRNYFVKPLAWKIDDPSYAGTLWTVKNLFELKMGQRILVEGNVFEHSWESAQNGFAWLLKTDNEQRLPTQDVTLRYNLVRGAAGGIALAGNTAPMFRIAIEHNLLLDIGTPTWGKYGGRLLQVNNVEDLTIAHNTAFATGALLSIEPPPSARLTITDNVFAVGSGVKASGRAGGLVSLASGATAFAFDRNVLVGPLDGATHGRTNHYVRSLRDVGFSARDADDYGLSSTSPFGKAGAGGSPLGADVAAIRRLTDGVKP